MRLSITCIIEIKIKGEHINFNEESHNPLNQSMDLNKFKHL